MNGSLRIWAIVSGAAVAAVLAAGVVVGVQPQLAAAATADDAAASVNAQNQATRIRLVSLSKLAAKSDALRAEDAVLQKAVPQILKPNTFIRRVSEVAALDGVVVKSVTPGAAAPYAVPASAAAGGAGPVLVKTDASITAAHFTVVPISVEVSGTADSVIQFTHDIQNDERLFLVTSVQTTVGDSSVVTASLGGSIYTLTR